jgi:4-amino-4-deoxy-L-arabinose transferase-like glycosyltransferase
MRNRSLILVVVVALAVRLVVVAFVYSDRTNPDRDHWRFGGEAGRIARSIVQGEGFSNPLFGKTGPTAWLAPVFPYLLAGIFKIFGIYSTTSAIVALSLDSLFSALTCIPVFFIARKQFGEKTALTAAWIWAFFPYAVYFSAEFIWSTTLTTLLLSLIFLMALYLETSTSVWPWIGFGLVSGLGALTDPVILSVAPFLGLWAWYRRYRSGRPWRIHGVSSVLAVLLVISPWCVRQYRAFHQLIPIRSCLGLELYFGNNKDSWHWGPPGYHPSDNELEWADYQKLGEIAYNATKFREALTFIGAHRLLYVEQTLRRIIYLWTGFWSFSRRYLEEEPADPFNIILCTGFTTIALMGLRRAWRVNTAFAMPYLILSLSFPIIYYLTHPEDYHRRPIDPPYVVLAAWSVSSWMAERRQKSQSATSA